jgi:hypothetical protein
MAEQPSHETADELAPEYYACPNCGERRLDWLVWDEDVDELTCAACLHRWTPDA